MRYIGCSINSLAAVTSNSRALLSRLRGQRFLLVKPWSFVIRDICIPSRSLHSSCNAAARCTETFHDRFILLWLLAIFQRELPNEWSNDLDHTCHVAFILIFPIFLILIRWLQYCNAKIFIMSSKLRSHR